MLPVAKHELAPYLPLLKTNGKYVIVGLPPDPFQMHAGVVVTREWRCPCWGGPARQQASRLAGRPSPPTGSWQLGAGSQPALSPAS